MLGTRILAAAIFTPAILGLIYVGGLALEVTCYVLSLLMLWEFLRLTLGTGNRLTHALAYLLGTLVLVATLGYFPAGLTCVIAPAATLLLFITVLLQPEPLESSMQRTALTALGVLYCAGLIPFLARLRALPHEGLALCMTALLCTWASDSGAYFVGRAVGRHKLYPRVSPGKTVEGGVGGLLSAMATALLIRQVFHVDIAALHAGMLGLIAASFGVMGDLCESMLKRSVGAKDSSHLIPGHGGVLDRFDGVMFAVPAFYIYVVVMLYGGNAP